MKRWSALLFTLALLLSHTTCTVTAYNYRDMLCGIAHGGYSAPAWVAFLTAIPYLAGALLCLLIGSILRKKAGT